MGVIILGAFLIFFEKRIKENGAKAFLVINAVLLVYIVFSIILNDYQEYVYKWAYGVPGADLTAHFEGARALANGVKIKDLENIAYRFSVSLSGLSYIVYAMFVRAVAFSPVIISYRFSLQLVYAVQSIIALLAADNLCRLFPSKKHGYNFILFFEIVSCVCIAQQASILMRDIWIFYFLSLLFCNRFESRQDKIVAASLVVVCAVLRFYTVLLTIPFFVWKYTKNTKFGATVSLITTLLFSVGQRAIQSFAIWFGIKWEFAFNYNIMSIASYVLFPNIISQTHNVQHLITGFHANFGGNTEWIYYMLACWNCCVYPIAAYGIYTVFREKTRRMEGLIWLLQIVNIALVYSVFYNSISEPRHKLLILFGLIFFFNEGIKKMTAAKKIIFAIAIIMFLLLLLFAVR